MVVLYHGWNDRYKTGRLVEYVRLKPGQRMHSAVCDAQVIVIKAPADEVELTCGEAALLEEGESSPPGVVLDSTDGDGLLIGKRYTLDPDLELSCMWAGSGSLAVNRIPLVVKQAKPLPSSD